MNRLAHTIDSRSPRGADCMRSPVSGKD